MQVAFYVRVSTERQQQAQTIEQQITRLREYTAKQDSWVVEEEHIFRDDGHSGAKLNRPGLDALRDGAAHAAFELILIACPDRLARNYVHQMVLLEELERHGCRVHFIDRPLSDDPHEQLVLQIRGAVAEYERTLIAERMRRGRQAKLRSGQLLPWTRPAYGYRLHPEHPRDPSCVQVAQAEAAVVQELFARYAEGGVTLHGLARELTDRGTPSPSGLRHWSGSSVRAILTNPAYAGQAASGRYRTVPARQRKSALQPVGRGTRIRSCPREEWVSIPVPAIITAEQFDEVQERLAKNQQQARRNTRHEYLLRGLVSCGTCKLSCQGRQSNNREERYRYYVCRGKAPEVVMVRQESCRARFTPAAQLDELVWRDLCAVLQDPSILTGALERAHSGAWLPEALQRRQATLRSVREGLERQRERLLDAYLAEAIELAVFQEKGATIRQQQEDLLGQERELATQGQRRLELGSLARSISDVCERLRTGLAQASFAQRRQLVELLIDRVIVTDGAVEIRYVIPTTEASTHVRFCQLRTDYFHAFPQPLAHRIARMPGGAAIDGAATPAAGVLGHVRRNAALAGGAHTLPRVVALVPAQRRGMKAARLGIVQQPGHRIALGRSGRAGHHEVHQHPVPVLHQGMGHEAQLRGGPVALLCQQSLRVGRALVGGIAPLLAVEVHQGVSRVPVVRRRVAVLRLEALEARGGFDERPVHREVLVGQQASPVGSQHHGVEQLLAHPVFQQPLPVLGEDGRGEDGV